MNAPRKVRDSAVLDFLESVPKQPFEGTAWRIVRKSRDPLRSSTPKGRWDDGSFEVLYTSLEQAGARAEMYFHLMRGQPVFPSLMEFRLYELDLRLSSTVSLSDLEAVFAAGVDTVNYGGLSYSRKGEEYTTSQKIGEAAHFLDCDLLVVPNARWACLNAVLFMDRISPDQISVRKDHGAVDWKSWQVEMEKRSH